MGQGQSDMFLIEQNIVQLRDGLIYKFMWIDPKITGAENKVNLRYFNEFMPFETFDNIESLKIKIDQLGNHEQAVVVCAASLQDTEYLYFQNQEKICTVQLFCSNKIRAKTLTDQFSKIIKAAFTKGQVVKGLKEWLSRKDINLCYFDKKDLSELNRYQCNWIALTNLVCSSDAKNHFGHLVKIIHPKQNVQVFVNTYNLQLQGQQAHTQAIQFAFRNNFFLKLSSETVKLSKNPMKLAYVRLGVCNISHAIQYFYQRDDYPLGSFFFLMNLNETEERKLINRNDLKKIMLTGLIFAKNTEVGLQVKERQVLVEIQIKSNNKKCKGFIIKDNKAIFNFGNYFKIIQFNPANKKLILQLVTFSNSDIQSDSNDLWLNKCYIEYLRKKFEGHSLAFWYSGDQIHFETYLRRKWEKCQNNNDINHMIWYKLENIRGKFKDLNQNGEIIRNSLEQLLAINNDNRTLLMSFLGQIFFKQGKFQKFKQLMGQIKGGADWALFRGKYGIISEEQYFRLLVYEIRVLFDQAPGESKRAHVKKLIEIQNELLADESRIVWDVYLDILQGIGKCFQELREYEKAIEIIQKGIQIISKTEGYESNICKSMNDWKKLLLEKQNEQFNKKERLAKEKKISSTSIRLSDLLSRDQKLNFEVAIDFALFD